MAKIPFPTTKIDISRNFLDRPEVTRNMSRATVDAFMKVGGTTRIVMQRIMLKRAINKHAPPGTPPYAHDSGKGPLLRRFVEFAVENPAAKNPDLIIGPRILPGKRRSVQPVPNLHEVGGWSDQTKNPRRVERRVGGSGIIRVNEISDSKKRKKTTTTNATTKYVENRHGKKILVTFGKIRTMKQLGRVNRNEEYVYGPMIIGPSKYEPRPFAKPAFATSWTGFPAYWKASFMKRFSK